MQIGLRQFDAQTVQWLTGAAAASDASRSSLARGLCDRLDWRDSSGDLATASARKVLPRLADKLGIALPTSRPGIPSGRAIAAPSAPDREVCCALEDLGRISLVPVKDDASRRRWEAVVDTWHPLGWARAPGGQMRYWISSSIYGVLGVIGFCAASWHQKARDTWIGWSDDARVAHIGDIVCNQRFMICPWVRVPNLATAVLAMASSRIADDWQAAYGRRPLVAYTYVDPEHTGTCYAAAGWSCCDEPTGGMPPGHEAPGAQRRVWTPLHWAATHSTVEVVEILLDSGADPRARDRNGNEPLHDVAWSDDPGVIKALVEAGADPEARNEKDATPLHWAAAYSDIPAVVTALVEAGADLGARDERGWTPLHWAAAYNEAPSVVEALLHAGAGLETKSDEWGLTPLHFAAWKSETPDVIATLLDAGANPTARTNSGGTPWDFAQNNEALQETEVLDWLDSDAALPGGTNDTVVAGETAYEETVTSSAAVSSDEAHASGDADDAGSTPIPVDATHCVKVHEEPYKEEFKICAEIDPASGECTMWAFRFEYIHRSYENTCSKPIVLRNRHFAKYGSDHRRSYVYDWIYPANYRTDPYPTGYILLVNNTDFTDHELSSEYSPPTEIAYCAEFVDTEMTPEYLYSDRYTLEEGSEFASYSGVVDHLRHQGINVGPEMKAYYDAYISSLAHSPCYAEVVTEPPVDYEHFPPLDWYEMSRISLFVTYHVRGGGFEALSFDEEADFGGVSFHDVGGTDTHYISDLPRPVGRN